jgi:chorismate-pyruvate lyase
VDAKRSLLDTLSTANDGQPPLSSLQRVLLVTDGTVTDVLEAFADEPIRVVKLGQELDAVDAGCVLRRTILLQGATSGTNYVHARSVFEPDHLHPEIVEGLLAGDTPLGRLLDEHRVETLREIVAMGFEAAGDCAAYFGVAPDSNLVFRTYRIIADERPMVTITEKFPVTWFSFGATL